MSRSLVWQYFDVGGDETENREKTVENREKIRFRFSGKNRGFGFFRFNNGRQVEAVNRLRGVA
jgi:hypothetical protein